MALSAFGNLKQIPSLMLLQTQNLVEVEAAGFADFCGAANRLDCRSDVLLAIHISTPGISWHQRFSGHQGG